MKKKICLVTSEESFLNNYGAALQGYALNYVLKELGFDVFVLKYRGGMKKPYKLLSLKGKLRRILSSIYHNFLTFISKIIFIFNAKKKSMHRMFKGFYDTSYSFANKKRINWYQVKNQIYDFDIYVCGSDQIWNPFFKNGENDLGYFLEFASDDKLKISYAPSFGCSTLPEKSLSNIKYLLNKFDYISVREKTGADLVEKSTGLKADVVLDPTMLLSCKQWENALLLGDVSTKNYILVYRFSNNNSMKTYVSEIAKLTSLDVVVIPLSDVSQKFDKDWRQAFETGPREFINLIRGAKLVCTDSFHATVFSLLFNVPFLVFERENYDSKGNNMNSRIYDLLNSAQLLGRIVNNYESIKKDIFNVDFSNFNNYINNKRSESLNWLKKAVFDYDRKKG